MRPKESTKGPVIIPLTVEHAQSVLTLYAAAAATGTLGRDSDEYDLADVTESLTAASADGLCLGWFDNGMIVGAVRVARLRPRRFNHVCTGLTAAVQPSHQGRGIGRALFTELLERIDALDPPVSRVELMLQSGNPSAFRLYRSLGFEEEGRLRQRVREWDGTAVDDIVMARLRPRKG